MKVVAKYSLVLGCTLAAVLAIFGFVRFRHERGELETDMRRDHTTILRVLQTSVGELWLDSAPPRATAETFALLERSTLVASTSFEWHPELKSSAETQQIDNGYFVSTFPVAVHDQIVGSIVARESLATVDEQLRSHAWLDFAGIVVIVLLCLITARIMGNWLVGRPVEQLVEQARRIGRRDLDLAAPPPRNDELGDLATELHTAAQSLADSLDQVRHADRLATVGKLAAGIAHELGTPLSIVGGHAQMIAGSEVTGDAALASARAIDAEATRMSKIVRQLLDFARRKGPEGSSCDPNEVARRCTSLLGVMAERAHVTCEVREAPTARALIDEDSLQQVVTNLAVNAIQSMPDGGSLSIAISRARASRDGVAEPCIQIDVSDTGTGLPPEIEAHLFEPFVTSKAPGDGTGLGLAVVHGIVFDHRGWITVATGNTGTTFSIHLQEAT